MARLSQNELRVLDAVADDVENLEQIYRAVALEFVEDESVPRGPKLTAGYWQERNDAILLSDVAAAMVRLVAQGLLEPVMDENGNPWRNTDHPSMVWRAWFRITKLGMAALAEHDC